MQPGQHGRRSSTKHPHGEEDDEQRGGEHRLPCVRRRVTDRQCKRHRSSQSCNTHTQTGVYTQAMSVTIITSPNPSIHVDLVLTKLSSAVARQVHSQTC